MPTSGQEVGALIEENDRLADELTRPRPKGLAVMWGARSATHALAPFGFCILSMACSVHCDHS